MCFYSERWSPRWRVIVLDLSLKIKWPIPAAPPPHPHPGRALNIHDWRILTQEWQGVCDCIRWENLTWCKFVGLCFFLGGKSCGTKDRLRACWDTDQTEILPSQRPKSQKKMTDLLVQPHRSRFRTASFQQNLMENSIYSIYPSTRDTREPAAPTVIFTNCRAPPLVRNRSQDCPVNNGWPWGGANSKWKRTRHKYCMSKHKGISPLNELTKQIFHNFHWKLNNKPVISWDCADSTWDSCL